MISDVAVHVTIVVDIPKISGPGLLPEGQTGGCGHVRESAVAIVAEELVDAARVGGTGGGEPAFRNVKIKVPVVVVVRPDDAVIAGVVAGDQRVRVDEGGIRDEGSASGVAEFDALRVIMAGKYIQPPIAVDLHEAHGLGKD